MQDKNQKYKIKMIVLLSFLIGGGSSALGLLISFILAKTGTFNSFDFFMSLPLVVQIVFIAFYFLLWTMLSFALYKELN